jgi:hypothetical protein
MGRSQVLTAGKRIFDDCGLSLVLLAAVALFFPMHAGAQSASADDLPDAPQATTQQSAPQSTTPTQQPAQAQPPATDSSSSAQQAPETKEQQQERAKRELEAAEKQRMLGVVPMFNVQSNRNAAPLSSKQKFQLFFKSSTDWYIFAITGINGEISMLEDEYPTYGEGVGGFAKYWGAAYADTFDGNLWGNAILTSWWKEDPRYYRMGHGKFIKRAAYSAVTTVWCRRDKGTWGPNYANVAGNFIGGAISNVYYPADQRGVGLTLGRGASVTYEGIVGAELAEFWPDIAQRLLKKKRATLDQQTAGPSGATAPDAQSAKPR